MFKYLENAIERPKSPFSVYTAMELWNDEYVSKKMLEYHLNPDVEACSRKPESIDQSVQFITKRFKLERGNSQICDLGCGPGLYTTRFSQHAKYVLGVDFSRNSIEYAKKKSSEIGLENIEYLETNYLDFTNCHTSFDLCTLIYCDFCALSEKQRKKLLSNIRGILKPGGFLVLDVFSHEFYKDKKEESKFERNYMNQFWSSDEYFCFFNSFKYETEKVVLDKYVIVEEKRKWEIYNWLKCYSTEEIKEEMEINGFEVKQIFSDVKGTPFNPNSKEFCVIAQKN